MRVGRGPCVLAGFAMACALLLSSFACLGRSKPTPIVPVSSPAPTRPPVSFPTPSPASSILSTPIPVTPVVVAPVPSPTSVLRPDLSTATAEATAPAPNQKDQRFGIITSGAALPYQVDALNVDWYIDYSPDPRTAPPGKVKVPYIQPSPDSRIPAETLTEYAHGAPGSYWYIGGEPNRHAQITPSLYARELDYYASTIKAADPTAKIIGPSILNWDFTCTGCAGFMPGSAWMQEFFDAYESAHGLGVRPPIDVYATDTYPLTWNSVPMTNWQVLVSDLTAYREWLDSNGLGDKPIWITEVASHWAYDSWMFDGQGKPTIGAGLDWVDDYRWDAMSDYITSLCGWLRTNGPSKRIEKWFLFVAYTDIREQVTHDGYAGIYLFQSGEPGAPLNQLGELYRDMALGLR